LPFLAERYFLLSQPTLNRVTVQLFTRIRTM
jgi:hypothetical protein